MMYYNIFITVYFIEQMPLALKNRVKNVAGNKNAEKSCTKGSVQKYDHNINDYYWHNFGIGGGNSNFENFNVA